LAVDHTPGRFVFAGRKQMRNTWLKVIYIVAIAVVTCGWLWFIAWSAMRLTSIGGAT
jgi:hypothetical protein